MKYNFLEGRTLCSNKYRGMLLDETVYVLRKFSQDEKGLYLENF